MSSADQHAPVRADRARTPDSRHVAVLGADGKRPPIDASAPSRDLRSSLVRAMRVAAGESHAFSVQAVRTRASHAIEAVHERTAHEADELRRAADAEATSLRDRAEAEIARIRAETDARIAAHAEALELEVAERQAAAARETARIEAAVAAYEAETEAFHAGLASLDDPATFAATAMHAPEPPPLDDDLALDGPSLPPADLAAVAEAAPFAGEDVDPRLRALEWTQPAAAPSPAAPEVPSAREPIASETSTRGRPVDTGPVPAARAAGPQEPVSAAAAAAGDERESGVMPVVRADLAPPPSESTRVVVTGLVNVASIASFKRHLARVRGVASVGVSSGPDGEFVFTARHIPHVSLREVVPTLPGFAARVTHTAPGTLTVSARDPETDL